MRGVKSRRPQDFHFTTFKPYLTKNNFDRAIHKLSQILKHRRAIFKEKFFDLATKFKPNPFSFPIDKCNQDLNLTSILHSEFYGHDCLQTCRCQTRELWGLFAEVREKSVVGFRSYLHFRKNAVLNIWRYLKDFYTYKKINNIFLKFHYYLLRMPKILEIGWIFHSEKRKSKTWPTRI